jgi:predicted phage terminase large subunit-like protein
MHDHNQNVDPTEFNNIIKDQMTRSNLTQKCHYWFFQIYFPHYMKYKSAEFQKELFALTEDTAQKNVVVEAFRGSSKTTIMGTSYSIWSILGVQQKKFVLIIAKTESQARQYLANIKMELESNKLLKADLGPFEEPNDEWRATSIVLPNYGARVTVASIENSIRGIKHGAHRPDLIICDDLEDLDIVKTAESREKMYKWLTGDIIPLGDKDTRLIVIGTKLHNDSIIMKLKASILKGEMIGTTRAYPFLDTDGKSLWPDKFQTQAEIDMFRKSVPSSQAWQREYMLQIIADDDQVVRPEWIQTYKTLPPVETFRYAASGVDPAISEKDNADYTAMVSGRVYGRKKSLIIYIMANPVNERMDFPKSIEKIKSVSKGLGNSMPTLMWIETVAYQKSLVDQLKADGFPAKEWKSQGTDKRARLSLVSNHIQAGTVIFPEVGAEKLIPQLTGFGTESHDDLCDAFCILVLSIIEQDSRVVKGYHALFEERLLNDSYSKKVRLVGDRRFGVVLAGRNMTHSTIVLRSDNAAEVVYHEPTEDTAKVAMKIIELAHTHDVPISDTNIFIDKTGRGQELCNLLRQFTPGHFLINKYEDRQRYGIDMNNQPQFDSNLYTDNYTRSYAKLADWLRKGGRLFGKPIFDDLLSIVWTEHGNKMKIIDRETLAEDGTDSSIPSALAMTMVKEVKKMPDTRQFEDDPFNDPYYDSAPQFPEIGI